MQTEIIIEPPVAPTINFHLERNPPDITNL